MSVVVSDAANGNGQTVAMQLVAESQPLVLVDIDAKRLAYMT